MNEDSPKAIEPNIAILFSEEEIQNISALLACLKRIRMRAIREGIDIDKFIKENKICTPFDN